MAYEGEIRGYRFLVSQSYLVYASSDLLFRLIKKRSFVFNSDPIRPRPVLVQVHLARSNDSASLDLRPTPPNLVSNSQLNSAKRRGGSSRQVRIKHTIYLLGPTRV
jgi:hypothetical protein